MNGAECTFVFALRMSVIGGKADSSGDAPGSFQNEWAFGRVCAASVALHTRCSFSVSPVIGC